MEPIKIGLGSTVTLGKGIYFVKEGSDIHYQATYKDGFEISSTAIAQTDGKFIMQVFIDTTPDHGNLVNLYVDAIIREGSDDVLYKNNLTIQPDLYNIEVKED